MKRRAKGLLAFLLAALLLAAAVVPAFADGRSDLPVPVILIHGMGDDILNEKGENVYWRHMPKQGLSSVVEDCAPLLLRALLTEKEEAWDACRKKVIPLVMSCFGPFFLDKNGEPSDGTHGVWDWEHGNLPNLKTETGYGWDGYDFFYDWRLDPFALAKTLRAYIRDVKKATGCDKVDVIARSAGNLPLIAYLAKYGSEDLRCVVFKVSPLCGMDFASAFMSGRLNLNAAAIVRYKKLNPDLQIEDELVNEAVDLLLSMTYDVMALDIAVLSLNHVVKRLYSEILVPLLRESYATFPSVWAMVAQEDYALARKNVFAGYEKEYAGLLKKIDRYDKQVRSRVNELILGEKKKGLKVAVLAKYGNYQAPPVGKHSNDVNDNMISLRETSFGATVAKFGETLPVTRYLWTMLNGKKEYISPDRMVDASTCLLPDTTWFIYGSEHSTHALFIEDYICGFFAANGKLTVFDDPEMPAFVLDDGESHLVPMTKKNAPHLESPKHTLRQSDGERWKLFRFARVLLRLLLRKAEKAG